MLKSTIFPGVLFGSMPIRIIFAIQTRSNSNEMISIQPVLHNKKQYLDLLLLADEQESMIDRYLERGEMFVLSEDGSIRASCVVTREAEDVFEIKNIAVYPQFQRRGYGKKLIQYLFGHYAGRCRTMLVGTGDSPLAIPFTRTADLPIPTASRTSLRITTTIPFMKRANN